MFGVRGSGFGMVAVAMVAVLTAGCAAKGGVVATPKPFPGATVPPRSVPESERAEVPAAVHPAVIALAMSLRGTPYRNGGSGELPMTASGNGSLACAS